MHSSLIAWIMRAIPFGTIIMYGALGETVTEKSGNLNLGVPGIMYLGGFAGFASAWAYENSAANPNGFVSILIALSCAILASMAGGLIYAFLTISLRANQNVTGLTLTIFGGGVANFFGGTLNSMAGGVGQISVAATSGRVTGPPSRPVDLGSGGCCSAMASWYIWPLCWPWCCSCSSTAPGRA